MLQSVLFPLRFLILLWGIELTKWFFRLQLITFGIFPKEIDGLKGILFAPLIHGDFMHLISNSVPLLILGTALFWLYPTIAVRVFVLCYVATGILVWLFARPSYHIGASGLVYGLALFLMAIGFFRKDFLSIVVSVLVILLYGSILWGVLPTQPGVSFESHFFGAVSGIVSAYIFGKKNQ
jgi:membrane associated rhomboid family serine protease